MQKIASGAPGKWPCTPAEAKAELAIRAKTQDPHSMESIDEDLQRLYNLKNQIEEAIKQRLDPKCWKGKHKEGTKIKGGTRVNNCVPNKK